MVTCLFNLYAEYIVKCQAGWSTSWNQDCQKNINNLRYTVEKAMATHSSTLAWEILWTEEPGSLVHGVVKCRTWLSEFTFTFHFPALEKEMATHSSILVWRIPGMGEPGGLLSMGSQRVGHDWSDLAAAAAEDTQMTPPLWQKVKRN